MSSGFISRPWERSFSEVAVLLNSWTGTRVRVHARFEDRPLVEADGYLMASVDSAPGVYTLALAQKQDDMPHVTFSIDHEHFSFARAEPFDPLHVFVQLVANEAVVEVTVCRVTGPPDSI